jgi:pimeloyl-ACP methyl ester carboxylesterase
MKTFILIHGAWHGSWCWENTADLLQNLGHKVYTIDLPSHHTNQADFTKINLNSYVQYVTHFIKGISEKVTLVGHSMAGVIISQVAEDNSDKIDKLVYVSAFVPDHRGSLIQEEKKAIRPSVALEVLIDEENNKIKITQSKKLRELFYNMCSAQQSHQAISHLQDQPLQPFLDHVSLSETKFGKVDKIYIECLQDNAIYIDDQRRMHQKLNCQVISLESDHSPFFSCPEKLVKILAEHS